MEKEKVDEKRAREWFRSKEVTQLRWELTDRYKYSAEDAECKLLAAYAESECSRLASRVEELEKGLRETIAYLKQEDFAASYSYLSPALEAAENALKENDEK